MSHTTVILLLAAATSAEGNLMPWQKVPALQSLVKQMNDTKGRRLQYAMMSSACTTACPKVKGLATAMTTSSQSSQSSEMARLLEDLCPHKEGLICLLKTDACQDEGSESDIETLATIPCFCECPGLAKASSFGSGNPSTEESDTISCALSSNTCAQSTLYSGVCGFKCNSRTFSDKFGDDENDCLKYMPGDKKYTTATCEGKALPDVKVDCGGCKVLVGGNIEGSTCDAYCAGAGLKCKAVFEDDDDNCVVKDMQYSGMKLACDYPVRGTSDVICECEAGQPAVSVPSRPDTLDKCVEIFSGFTACVKEVCPNEDWSDYTRIEDHMKAQGDYPAPGATSSAIRNFPAILAMVLLGVSLCHL